MSRQYCFLCASDEGVFLDITADNKQIYHEQFEICSLDKVLTAVQLPAKICYKCAYELNQCSSFVQKYKRATKQKTNVRKHCCSLCREPAKNGFIFDLSKEELLQDNTLAKIQKLFNNDLGKSYGDHKFICLSCRYTIDVLLDLKNICEETVIKLKDVTNQEINYLTFPKIKTTVVSRKTTLTESTRTNLYKLQELENNSNEMIRTRSQNNKLSNQKSNEKAKLRVCNKCRNSVKTGDDMYKIHKTGNTVCKSCWKSMNIHINETEKQVQQNVTETKFCTVFLKDVLKDTEIKEKKLYRIDEDDEGNKTYVVTDKDPVSESKLSKAVNDSGDNTTRQSNKRSVKNAKSVNENVNNEDVPIKKQKSSVKKETDINSKESVIRQLRQLGQKNGTRNVSQSSDSDSSILKTTRKNERTLTRHKRATGSSLSDADVDNKHNRKKLKTILRGISVAKYADVSDESSSNEDVISKRKRIRFMSASPIAIDLTDDDKVQENSEKNVPLRKTRNTIQKPAKLSAEVITSQELQFSESDDKRDIFESQTYVCDECGASYENKLRGLIHKLTHYKQPELKLQKLSNENLIKEIPALSEVVDSQSEDPSESIVITVDDDEEESMEDEKNLNTNDHTDVISDTENKINFSKKEILEDAVDVKLVMKESDDDQINKIEKEIDLQEDEAAEVSISKQNESKTGQQEDELRERKSNFNNDAKTDDSIHGSAEDENVDPKATQEILNSDTEDTQETHEAEGKQKIGDEIKETEEEIDITDDIKDNEKEKGIVDDVKDNEEEKGTVDDVKDNEEEKDIIDDVKDNEEDKIERTVSEKQGLKTDYRRSLDKSDKDFNMGTVGEDDEGDPSKRVEQHNIENKDKENETDVIADKDDLIETVEQKSPKSTQEINISDENVIEAKTSDLDSKESENLETVVLPEEGRTIDKNYVSINNAEISEPHASKQERLTNDSANAAAEVLQEVLDLASAEVQKRQDIINTNTENDSIEAETLENISREIHNSADMPPLKIDDAKSEENHIRAEQLS